MDDAERLRQFLAERDAPCPGCGYNLRGCEQLVCPECSLAIRMDRLAEQGAFTPRGFLIGDVIMGATSGAVACVSASAAAIIGIADEMMSVLLGLGLLACAAVPPLIGGRMFVRYRDTDQRVARTGAIVAACGTCGLIFGAYVGLRWVLK